MRPIFDINGITASQAPTPFVAVYVNGSPVTSGWTVSTTGMLTFGSPPASGATIAVDFSYFKRVRFVEDHLDFSNFMQNLYKVGKIPLEQVWS